MVAQAQAGQQTNQLARIDSNLPTVAMTFDDMQTLATSVAKSGLFGCRTPEAALTLMMLAQAENMHPIQAMRMYHIIEGKPSMRADAMQAKFQQAGGRIKWIQRTDEVVEAEFSHPDVHPEPLRVKWDNAKVQQAGLQGNHKKYPVAMKSARVVSEGIRAVMPQVVLGLYTPEEVQDFDGPKEPPRAEPTQDQPRRVASKTVETPQTELPEPKPFATAEQVAEVVELLKLVKLPDGTVEKWFAKAGANGWSDLPAETMAKCIDYIKQRKPITPAADAQPAAPEPVPEETLEEKLAKLDAKQLEAELLNVARAQKVMLGQFHPGLARYVKNVCGDGKTVADLSPKQRVELIEAIGECNVDWDRGAIRDAVAA